MDVKQFEFNSIEENTYVLYDETKEAAIIDCGAYFPKEKMELRDFISGNQMVLKRLLNTHLHLDHTFGNEFIFNTYGVFPEYHRLEERMPPELKKRAEALGIKIGNDGNGFMKYLKEGDVVSFGNVKLDVILVPGHSPGGLCFYSKANAALFSGDVLFRESIGSTDMWGGDERLLITGIRRKLLTLPENTIVYPGHGQQTTIGHERKHNPYLK